MHTDLDQLDTRDAMIPDRFRSWEIRIGKAILVLAGVMSSAVVAALIVGA